VTGMSGTGKSSALERLRPMGFRTIDTDEGSFTEWSKAEGGWVWREAPMAELLADDEGQSLYVSGTVSNQGRFYDRFDAVVLLSAPASVLLSRLKSRTTNPYGKTAAQRETVLRDLAEVEPLLRRSCTHEIERRSRSKTSSGSSPNSVAIPPLRSTTYALERAPRLGWSHG
jgi:shikimate kinase